MKDKPNQYGMGEIFGTQENFAAYQISNPLEQHVADLQGKKRLVLTGYGNKSEIVRDSCLRSTSFPCSGKLCGSSHHCSLNETDWCGARFVRGPIGSNSHIKFL